MTVELEARIPPELIHVNLIPISLYGRKIGYINHLSEHIDGDLFLCHIDVFKEREAFVLKIIKE